jgi:hypothetical protein
MSALHAIAPLVVAVRDRRIVALHEAGHAVAGILAGVDDLGQLVGATVDPGVHRGAIFGGACLARVVLRCGADRERAALMLLGGPAIERVVFGRARMDRCGADLRRAAELLRGDVARVGELWRWTTKIVRAHRREVVAVGARLAREGTMSGRDIRLAMKTAGGAR